MTYPNRIGITGGAGFIGSHLCERLLAEGREVVTVDDFSHGNPANMTSFIGRPELPLQGGGLPGQSHHASHLQRL